MTEQTTVVEYGVLYANNVQDWKAQSWFGTINTPEARASFNEQYQLRMEAMGVSDMSVRFLQREVTTIISNTIEISDDQPMLDWEDNDHTNEELADGPEPGSDTELREPTGDSDPAERDAGSGERGAEGGDQPAEGDGN